MDVSVILLGVEGADNVASCVQKFYLGLVAGSEYSRSSK